MGPTNSLQTNPARATPVMDLIYLDHNSTTPLLGEVAAATVERAGAKANPRPASAAEVEALLQSIY